MSCVVGVDSGGTKTILAACDRAAEITSFHLVESIAPTPNAEWVGNFEALYSLDAQVISDAKAHVLGLPFHGEDQAYSDHQIAVVRKRLGPAARVENDVRIAFDGAFAGTAGVLVLAGTGSMAWGSLNTPNAPHFRVGGWGETIGDEGSGFWIGQRALQAISRHLDGRQVAADFSAQILAHLDLTPANFHAWINSTHSPRQTFARLAIPVSSLAQAGNTTAQDILAQAANHLAEHAQTIWRKTETDAPLAWSYAGGVFNSPYFLERLQERLSSAPLQPRLPPIGGALLRAAHSAGWSTNDDWISKLAVALEDKLEMTTNRGNS
jgi:N-acetylglucosamine kinase